MPRKWKNVRYRRLRGLTPPTHEELARFYGEQDEINEEEVTASMIPTALADLPQPLAITSLTEYQNQVIQLLIGESDKDGHVTIEEGRMATTIQITRPIFRMILTQLQDKTLLVPFRKNKGIYKLRFEDIRAAYVAQSPKEEMISVPKPRAVLSSDVTTPARITVGTVPMPTTEDENLLDLWQTWKDRIGRLTPVEAECIREQYKTVNGRGFDGYTWVREATELMAKKNLERHNSDYFVGIIRNWMIYGYGYIPTQEENELCSTFTEIFGVVPSDNARRYLAQLMSQYGIIKCIKIMFQKREDVQAKFDISLLMAQTVGSAVEQSTGQQILFRKEH